MFFDDVAAENESEAVVAINLAIGPEETLLLFGGHA